MEIGDMLLSDLKTEKVSLVYRPDKIGVHTLHRYYFYLGKQGEFTLPFSQVHIESRSLLYQLTPQIEEKIVALFSHGCRSILNEYSLEKVHYRPNEYLRCWFNESTANQLQKYTGMEFQAQIKIQLYMFKCRNTLHLYPIVTWFEPKIDRK
jgi:hypothetical protein